MTSAIAFHSKIVDREWAIHGGRHAPAIPVQLYQRTVYTQRPQLCYNIRRALPDARSWPEAAEPLRRVPPLCGAYVVGLIIVSLIHRASRHLNLIEKRERDECLAAPNISDCGGTCLGAERLVTLNPQRGLRILVVGRAPDSVRRESRYVFPWLARVETYS